MNNIIWQTIPGFEGLYEINTQGDIRSIEREFTYYDPRWGRYNTRHIKSKFMRIYDNCGYRFICLRKEGEYYQEYIHRLVALTFIPNPENKPQVNHIDGNKSNNSVDNLEWVTGSKNIRHMYDILGFQGSMKGKHLSEEHKAKLSRSLKGRKHINHRYDIDVLSKQLRARNCSPVRCLNDNKLYRSANHASNYYHCDTSTVLSSIRNHRPTRLGLQFEYVTMEEYYK